MRRRQIHQHNQSFNISVNSLTTVNGTSKIYKDNTVIAHAAHSLYVMVTSLARFLLLWLPCVADADIIFLPCGFFLLFVFFVLA